MRGTFSVAWSAKSSGSSTIPDMSNIPNTEKEDSQANIVNGDTNIVNLIVKYRNSSSSNFP